MLCSLWELRSRMTGKNHTFSSGQCVLSLRKGRRFGRSYSAYRPICLSWYFWPLWWSRLNSLWRYCGGNGEQSNQFWTQFLRINVIKFTSHLNSPHAEAQACLLVLPPPCPSVSTEMRNRISRQQIRGLNEKLREARYTHRYLVFIVQEHVNSFLSTQI